MPSPTSRTRPTSRTSSWALYCSISGIRTETISSALNFMACTLEEMFPNIEQLGADRGVVQPVADADDHAADDLRIDHRHQGRLQLHALTQLLDQFFTLVVRQRNGRSYMHILLAFDLAGEDAALQQ